MLVGCLPPGTNSPCEERRHVMLLLFGLFLFLVGACLILLLPALWGEQIFHTYREGRTVNCPETHAPVSVRFNALRGRGPAWPVLRSCDWPIARAGRSTPGAGRSAFRMRLRPSLRASLTTLRGEREELCICPCCWPARRPGSWAWLGTPNTCSGHDG